MTTDRPTPRTSAEAEAARREAELRFLATIAGIPVEAFKLMAERAAREQSHVRPPALKVYDPEE